MNNNNKHFYIFKDIASFRPGKSWPKFMAEQRPWANIK